jgi:hypothetical protein
MDSRQRVGFYLVGVKDFGHCLQLDEALPDLGHF